MKHSFSDAGDLRKYFAAIPNIVFTLGLNPYELALYSHFKQAAGDKGGVCWKSRATVAKESGMSAGMVSKARIALEQPRSELKGQPLITAKEQANPMGGKPTWHITITDIWAVNMAMFTPSPRDVASESTSQSVSATSHSDGSTSPHAHKEKLFKKNKEEEGKRDFLAELKRDPLYAHVDFDFEVDKMLRWLARPENKGRRMTERFVSNWLNKIDRPVSPNGNGATPRKVSDPEYQKKIAAKMGYTL